MRLRMPGHRSKRAFMIYLDYQATTPLAPEAREAMLPWLGGPESSHFGNPHSPHRMGRMAGAAVDRARDQVAALFPPGGRVHFTGSACEAISLAIKGNPAVRAGRAVAYGAIEHAAVVEAAQTVGNAHVLAVDGEGITRTDMPLPDGLGLLAIMQVNNEIGTVQPVAELAPRARAAGALVLVDAVQAAGKFPIAEADMIAVSAHKLYGPKGIGALWVRDGVSLAPLIDGGRQEGVRSGTLNPALVAGFGAAAAIAGERMEADRAHAEALWARAVELFRGWQINGSTMHRNHANISLRRDGLDVARLMSDCRDVMFSAGSACASGSGKTSHVLKAIGLTDAQAKNTIRLGWGRYTTMAEIEAAAVRIVAAADAQ